MNDLPHFQSTIWTVIQRAKAGDSAALNDFVQRYRPAVLSFIVREGIDAEHAEDVAQEVFLRIVLKRLLTRVERTRGKFRSFVIAVTKNVLGGYLKRERAIKRGGRSGFVSLEGLGSVHADGDAHDETFDHLWVLNLVKLAMDRLKEESRRRGIPYAETLHLVTEEQCDYKTAADRLGKSETDVRNYVRRARTLLAEYVREEVSAYAYDAEDCARELASLDRILKTVRRVPE